MRPVALAAAVALTAAAAALLLTRRAGAPARGPEAALPGPASPTVPPQARPSAPAPVPATPRPEPPEASFLALPERFDPDTITVELLDEIEAAHRRSPGDADLGRRLAAARSALGEKLRRAGDVEGALSWLALARQLDPAHDLTLLRLARAELDRRRPARAREALDAVAPERRTGASWHALLGEALYQEDRLPEALAALEAAHRLAPEAWLRERIEGIEREIATGAERAIEGRRFRIVHSAGQPASLGRDVLAALEAVYDDFARALRVEGLTVTAVLYTDIDYRAVTGVPDWAAASYDGKIRLPVGSLERIDDDYRATIRHELAHAFIWHAGGAEVPRWLHEGLAQWLAGRRVGDLDLDPLDRERIGRRGVPEDPRLFYAQALLRVEALLDRIGLPRLAALLADMKRGRGFAAALGDNARLDWERFLADLEREVGR